MQRLEIVPHERLEQCVAACRDQGADVRDHRAVGDEPWLLHGVTVTGHVDDLAEAAVVVLQAARGADVLVATAPAVERLLAHDLGRLRAVDASQPGHSPGGADDGRHAAVVAAMTDETRNVLLALADGLSIGEAAARCFLSERTAFRRLTGAKRQLGVATTAEAVAAVAAHSSR